MLNRCHTALLAGVAMAMSMLAGATGAQAFDVVRVGKTASNALAFTPPEIGTAVGIWKKHGIELKVLQYAGDGKMQQGLIANEIEFGFGSGPAMGFIAKDVPAKTVGVIANEPLSMGLIVSENSAVKGTDDLKGRKIGITTNGSLTYWLARALARRQGWAPDAIRTVPMGSISGQIAGLKSGAVDGFIMSASVGSQSSVPRSSTATLPSASQLATCHGWSSGTRIATSVGDGRVEPLARVSVALVIGVGVMRVDQVLLASPSVRRGLIEEVAGLGKFKRRRIRAGHVQQVLIIGADPHTPTVGGREDVAICKRRPATLEHDGDLSAIGHASKDPSPGT